MGKIIRFPIQDGGGNMKKEEITYEDVADFFIALSNYHENLITNKKLQKLLYYAQAWHLAIFEKPLFDGKFQAWIHGPVLPDLYQDYKSFKWHPIEREDLDEKALMDIKEKLGKETVEFLEELKEEYFGLTAYELERLTHLEEPWKKARRGVEPDQTSNEEIKEEWMQQYYSKFIKS